MPGIFRLLLLLFPFLEIVGFVIAGQELGVLRTLGLVLLSGFVGVLLIRQGGLNVLGRVRTELDAGRDPGRSLVKGFVFVLAGFLLLVPGFLSDLLALALLLPPVRDLAWRRLRTRMPFVASFSANPFGRRRAGPQRQPAQSVIELEREEYSSRPDPSSPWAGGSHDDRR